MAKSKSATQSIESNNDRLWNFVVRSSNEVATWPSWKVSGTTTPESHSGPRPTTRKSAKPVGR